MIPGDSMAELQARVYGTTSEEVQEILRREFESLKGDFGLVEVPLTEDKVLPPHAQGYGIKLANKAVSITVLYDLFDRLVMAGISDAAGNPLFSVSDLAAIRKFRGNVSRQPGPVKVSSIKDQALRQAEVLRQFGDDLLKGDFSAVPVLRIEHCKLINNINPANANGNQ